MHRSPSRVPSSRVIAYLRVSTIEQAASGLGLEAQRARLEAEAAYRGWQDVEWITDDGYSAKSLNRPGLSRALKQLGDNDAGVLVVTKLDRLSRSVIDFTTLLALAEQQGWALVVLDLGLDLTTPNGKFVAQIMSSVAELERNLISERTRAALAAKRAQGHRLGGPIRLPHQVRESIRCARADGATLAAIAGRLNRDAIPTAQGGRRWYASTVAAVLRSIELDGCSNAIS